MSGPAAAKAENHQVTGKTSERAPKDSPAPTLSDTHASILTLQRSVGNQAVGSLMRDAVPSIARSVVGSGGQPLDTSLRGEMEQLFGEDFGQVRLHTDNRAAAAARAERAAVYTVGNDIVFGAGRFLPDSPVGRRLLAHELAHVVQQSRLGQYAASPASETEARTASERAGAGQSTSVRGVAPVGIQRAGEEEEARLAAQAQNAAPSPATRGALPPGSEVKVEARATSDAAGAAQAAQAFQRRYPTKLDPGEGGKGLTEMFNRTGNLSTPQLRRGASPELNTLVWLLEDDRVVKVTVIPSAKGQPSCDLFVEYADGRLPDRIEITAVTSAPTGRQTQRPTDFPEGKSSQGRLTSKTNARLATLDDIKAAIRRKCVGSGLQVSVPIAGIPPGGRVVIDIPFGSTDPKMLEQAMSDMASQIHSDVRAVTFVVRVRDEADILGRQFISYERSGPRTFSSLPLSAGPRPAQRAASGLGASATATGQAAATDVVASTEQAGIKQIEKTADKEALEAIQGAAARRLERQGEKAASDAAADFLRRRAAEAASKRSASFAPVLGWAFAVQDIRTGVQDITHGDIPLGAATIAVAVIDAEADALHAADVGTGVGGTALSLTVQAWATAMQVSFAEHRMGKRASQLREYINKHGKLPPQSELSDYYGLNDEEIMLLSNDISGFGKTRQVTATMVRDEMERRIAEMDTQLKGNKLDPQARQNLEAGRQQLAQVLLPMFKNQAQLEERAQREEVEAQKAADFRAWKKRMEKQAPVPTAPSQSTPAILASPTVTPKAPVFEPLPGMTVMGNRPDSAAELVRHAEYWTKDLMMRGTALLNRTTSDHPPDSAERRAFTNEVATWRQALVEVRRFYPNLVDVNETERKLRDLNGEFGPQLDRIRSQLGGG